jgi:alkylation response protein AidB-like acyl-CoA dehydrogenase
MEGFAMQWKLSDEQEAYQEAFRGWLGGAASRESVRAWLDAADSTTFQERLVADGWSGVGLDEASGGQGGGLLELALTAEELARVAAPSSVWTATMLAIPALAGRDETVRAALGGEALAFLVPADQLPDNAPSLEVDDQGAVTGDIPRVLGGAEAVHLVVLTGSADDRHLRLVRTSDSGVTATPRGLLDRSRTLADIRLDSVPSEVLDVDVSRFLGDMTARVGVLVAADSLGATERMLDLSVEYSKQRKQFGVPIGSFQAVKHAAAAILVGVEAARSVTYFAAASAEAREPDAFLHAAAAKAQVTAEGNRAADSALTIHGAIGYTWEHDLHLFYKRARLDEALFGTPTEWNARLADALALV